MKASEGTELRKRSQLQHRESMNHFSGDAIKTSEQKIEKQKTAGSERKSADTTHIIKEKFRRIDLVLVYEKYVDENEITDREDREEYLSNRSKREEFEELIKSAGCETQEDVVDSDDPTSSKKTVYVKVHTPLPVLCAYADKTNLEMPIEGCAVYDGEDPGCFGLIERWLTTDNEDDYVSAPYRVEHHLKFQNHDDPDNFFRPCVRSYLTYNMLINLTSTGKRTETCTKRQDFSKKGLLFLLLKKVYLDAFSLHDEALHDPALQEDKLAYKDLLGSQFLMDDKPHPDISLAHQYGDTREILSNLWAKKFIKYQPLWKIRNYFGEKIALYFAWAGTLIITLWIPTLFGLGVFFYGLYVSITESSSSSSSANSSITTTPLSLAAETAQTIEEAIRTIQAAFDNKVTPYFAIVVCLWGTIFLEVWKRKNATLAYEWDVDTFESAESDRPEFQPTNQRPDPVIPDEIQYFYPFKIQFLKFCGSLFILLFMCLVAVTLSALVILYRVWTSVKFCTPEHSAAQCLIVSALLSTILQAVAIMVLGRIYDKVAALLTDWENHRTETEYKDALILKLFAFQFVNSYSSLFYIAFFRGVHYQNGIFGIGAEYVDKCGNTNNCMGMLSLQVLILMIAKPVPKFVTDVVIPWVRKLWRVHIRRWFVKVCCCCCTCRSEKVMPSVEEGKKVLGKTYLQREHDKPKLNDFTLQEFTEKVILYGYLMLFTASMPLAPLIALVILLIDIRVDAKRMLWWYQRPVAYMAQDIGVWFGILQFLNLVGVATNAFLITYTSTWGKSYSTTTKLWIVIGFEHIVLALKFITAIVIPDVPANVELAIKREKYNVSEILEGNAPGKKSKSNGIHEPGPLRPSPNPSMLAPMIRPTAITSLGSGPPRPTVDGRTAATVIDPPTHETLYEEAVPRIHIEDVDANYPAHPKMQRIANDVATRSRLCANFFTNDSLVYTVPNPSTHTPADVLTTNIANVDVVAKSQPDTILNQHWNPHVNQLNADISRILNGPDRHSLLYLSTELPPLPQPVTQSNVKG